MVGLDEDGPGILFDFDLFYVFSLPKFLHFESAQLQG